MIQQGQVFKLKTKGAEGQPLWAVSVPARRSRFGETAGRWVRDPCGGGVGAAEGS